MDLYTPIYLVVRESTETRSLHVGLFEPRRSNGPVNLIDMSNCRPQPSTNLRLFNDTPTFWSRVYYSLAGRVAAGVGPIL